MDDKISRVARVVGVTALGVTVWANAAGSDAWCIAHPLSLSCDNPAAPGPQAPDETVPQPNPMMLFTSALVTVTSTSVTPNGLGLGPLR